MLLGIKRIYEKVEVTDGTRILVDRLWPRGVRKSTAHIDRWMKEVAPNNELRIWFGHDPAKWEEFRKRYADELKGSKALDELLGIIRKEDVTLVYSAHDAEHNNAVVLAELINERL
ncbi:MAG: DUF488 domain-containing protein [Candidatus Marsarchaeota archaeon]|jgi:uncharacterized protein YeaO (DUF488 family)|nr:DUF488 domain-containing protein [Candidatus Marsarchaeota archaeon]